MSNLSDQLSAQGPIAVPQSQVVQFIIDALRAGERAILISGQDPASTHVPDEALAAGARASVRVLHIGHPLPPLLELQDKIGRAAGITGGLGIAPPAMARLLLTSVPRQSVVLAIDDADTLPRQSLYYLAQLSNALAGAAPALQIVFAAGPALLERLSHPDFETFRNCVAVSGEKDSEQKDDWIKSQFAKTRAREVIAPRTVQLPPRPGYMTGREALRLTGNSLMAAVLTVVCLLAIGYDAFLARTDVQTRYSASAVNSNPLQDFAAAPYRSSSTPPGARETDKTIASLIDQFETAAAPESPGAHPSAEAAKLVDRIETLATTASPDGLLMVILLKDRIAARVIAALDAGRYEEALQLEQYLGWSGSAAATAATDIDGTPTHKDETTLAQTLRPDDAGEAKAAGKADQPIMFPNLVGPAAAPAVVFGPPATGAQPAQLAAVQDGVATADSAHIPAFAPVRVARPSATSGRVAHHRAASRRIAHKRAAVWRIAHRRAASRHEFSTLHSYWHEYVSRRIARELRCLLSFCRREW